MCCNRSHRCRRKHDNNVAGDFGIQRIALRGPGCIDGTGRCQGVLGTGGRCICNGVLGTGEDRCEEVMGTGGRRHHRCRHDNWLWNDLETPTTVPR